MDDRLALAQLYANAGDFHRPQRLVVDAYTESLARGPVPDHLDLWWHAWPKPFEAEVRGATLDGAKIEPQLVYAIMREESGFNPRAESWANARGLMQLMQGTAESMASRIGMRRPRTADLFDPMSHVPLTRFDSVTVISAETGELWSSPVRRLGPSEVAIEGTELLVEGVVLHPPEGRTALFYNTVGVPIRYEYYVEGRLFEAVLRHLPPPGIDEEPVPGGQPAIRTVDLD